MWKKIGKIGVDSGTVIVGDPCYFMDGRLTSKECKTKQNKQFAQLRFSNGPEKAVFASSGLGDGCYPVYANFEKIGIWGERITEIKVVFIRDNAKADKLMRRIYENQSKQMAKK